MYYMLCVSFVYCSTTVIQMLHPVFNKYKITCLSVPTIFRPSLS